MSEHSQHRLGELLQEAREKREMSLSDVAGVTHVRKEYLQAIDEGRWQDLPENVYTRNFLRLYASAVGMDEALALSLYSEERYGTSGKRQMSRRDPVPSQATHSVPARQVVSTPTGRATYAAGSYGGAGATVVDYPGTAATNAPRGGWLTPLLIIVMLAALGVWLWQSLAYEALWSQAQQWHQAQTWLPWVEEVQEVQEIEGFQGADTPRDTNNVRATAQVDPEISPSDGTVLELETTQTTAAATPTQNTSPLSPLETAATPIPVVAGDLPATERDQVLLTVRTEPEGATISLDGFAFPEPSPLRDALVTPGRSRTLSIELEGYEPIEEAINLTLDRDTFYRLEPIAPEPSPVPDSATASSSGLEGRLLQVEPSLPPFSLNLDGVEGMGGGRSQADVLVAGSNLARDAQQALASSTQDEASPVEETTSEPTSEPAILPSDVGELVLQMDEDVWLEVYSGAERGEGERLTYRLVEAGEVLRFDTPVFVFAGNSQAVQVSQGGQALGTHGEDVTGKLYQ